MVRSFAAIALALPMTLNVAVTANAASFNCAKAKTESEKAICSKPTLNVLDQRMGHVYFSLLKTVGPSGAYDQFRAEQFWWLGVRDACGADAVCLRGVYHDRINALNGYIVAVKASK